MKGKTVHGRFRRYRLLSTISPAGSLRRKPFISSSRLNSTMHCHEHFVLQIFNYHSSTHPNCGTERARHWSWFRISVESYWRLVKMHLQLIQPCAWL